MSVLILDTVYSRHVYRLHFAVNKLDMISFLLYKLIFQILKVEKSEIMNIRQTKWDYFLPKHQQIRDIDLIWIWYMYLGKLIFVDS